MESRQPLTDINLTVRSGEHWALIGPDGEDKSAILTEHTPRWRAARRWATRRRSARCGRPARRACTRSPSPAAVKDRRIAEGHVRLTGPASLRVGRGWRYSLAMTNRNNHLLRDLRGIDTH